ncbi:MAG: HDOD domain-containing protein [Gammaproteobacteria bacterium]|nr:HDOD domain-containing protein [Gammaproteobacteria bacterium]
MPARPAPRPRQHPTRIGRYVVKGILGRGAQGVVYLATDPELDREVAIKTLTRRTQDAATLLKEAQLVGRMKHPGIVPVYDAGRLGDVPYVVYERVTGRTLDQVLKEEPRLPLPRIVAWMTRILDALEYAHGQQVVHRDIKPANVVIQEDDTPRVLDFGIALPSGTETKVIEGLWGTFQYLAPEMVDKGRATAATDIFSLGLILFEMLTGRRAITEDDPMAAMYHIAHRPVPAPSSIRPEVAPGLDGIVSRALQKAPDARYSNAGEMRDALAVFADPQVHEHEQRRQSTLNFLLRRMRQKPDFPAIGRHISEISQKTAAIDRASVDELTNLILEDYALTSKLLRLVNSSYYGQYGGSISTISRAVVILGFNQVRMAALSLLLFEHIADKPNVPVLKEIGGQAFFSGLISRRLAADMAHADAEQGFVSAMFHTLGRYLSAYYFPDEDEEISRLMDNQGLSEEAAAVAVLGLTFEALGTGVGREWHLPSELLEGMRTLSAGETPRRPANPREAMRLLSCFANEVATAMGGDDPGACHERLEQLQQRYGQAVRLAPGRMQQVISEGVEDIRRFSRAAAIDLGDNAILRNARRLGRQEEGAEEGDQQDDPGAEASGEGDVPSPQTTLLSGIQDISQALLDNYSINDILIMILETLFRGLGFTRVVLFINNARQAEMNARFGLGRDIDKLLPRLSFSTTGAEDMFSRAVREHEDIIQPQGPRAKDVPDWHRQLVSPSTFALYPVVIGNRCLGLIYADRDERNRPITTTERNYLNTLRNQAALAIRQRS